MRGTIKMLFWNMFASMHCLLITIISLSYVLKLWIELIKQRNHNSTNKFYWVEVFQNLEILVEISKNSKILKFQKILSREGAPALRVIRAGTWLTVHRSLPYQNSIELGQSGAAHADARDHQNVVLEYVCIDALLVNYDNKFKLCIEALDRANKIEKSQFYEQVLLG